MIACLSDHSKSEHLGLSAPTFSNSRLFSCNCFATNILLFYVFLGPGIGDDASLFILLFSEVGLLLELWDVVNSCLDGESHFILTISSSSPLFY